MFEVMELRKCSALALITLHFYSFLNCDNQRIIPRIGDCRNIYFVKQISDVNVREMMSMRKAKFCNVGITGNETIYLIHRRTNIFR